MKRIFMICMIVSAIGFAVERDFSNEIGGGVAFSNEIYKTEKKSSRASFLPIMTFSRNGFYLSPSEAGVNFLIGEGLLLSGHVDFADGYEVKGNKLEKGYKTFKDRKEQIAFGGKIGYIFGNAQAYISGMGGKRGSSGEIGISYAHPFGDKLVVTAGAGYTMYSKKFTDYYFGVNKEDLGGKLQKVYKPGKASSLGFQLGAEYKLTDRFSAIAMVGTESFSKEIKNSPVVRNSTSVTGGIGIKYNF